MILPKKEEPSFFGKIHLNTINLGWFIVDIKGLQVSIIMKLDCSDGIPSHKPAILPLTLTHFNLDLRVKVTQNVARVPSTSCDLNNTPAKFKVATSNGLGGDAFTRKYIIGQGQMKCCPVPSTSCDLRMHLQSFKLFRRRCIYKKYII